jgi:multidrug resistance efflux pump
MKYKIDKRNYFLLGTWILISLTLLGISLHYNSAADAIVAQVDPQRVAISYQKGVKLQSIRVIPGQDVKKGDTLLIVERPDLELDIDQSENKLNGLKISRQKTVEEYNNKILSNDLDKQAKLFDLDQQINLVSNRISSNKNIIENLSSFENEGSISIDSLLNNNQVKLKRLLEEKANTEKSYEFKMKKLEQEKSSALHVLDNEIDIREKELALLDNEKNDLVKVSPVKGTVGNVFAQIDELVQPYTTIITIYEANPTIIKAYTSEHHRQNVSVGDKVLVESSNREYSITGEISEVGSRITDFPQRLLENRLELYGQEIFISIPENNKFLNGEKVYVRLKPTNQAQ